MYINIEQMSKWIVDNESWFSHWQRKELQTNKEECYNTPCSVGLEMEISILIQLLLGINTEMHIGICLEMS